MTTTLPALPIWVDGELKPADEPAICADDLGFLLGMSLFETILQEEGYRHFEELHLERMREGAPGLGLQWPPPIDPAFALARYGEALGDGSYAVRITLTRGRPGGEPRLVVGARRFDLPPDPGIKLHLADHVKTLDLAVEGIKTASRVRSVLAREEAQARGAWDALISTTEGDISEGTVCNLWVVRDGRYLTPGLERGCLPGICRGMLVDGLRARGFEVSEGRVERADIVEADEVFISSSIVRVLPVTEVIGLVSGKPGSKGPATLRAREVVTEMERTARRNRS